MLIIKSPTLNAYENIATEEFLLKKKKEEEIFLLYINKPSIIVGKFQNTIAEVNYPYVEEHKIKVVRRLSGGGAVYHDEGNLNFSFHIENKNEDFSDFEKFTRPIVDFLNNLGVKAELAGRNDLLVEGKKFSGNAKLLYKDKLVQHGTILINSNMQVVADALKVNPLKFKGKATQSVRSRVTNIIDYLPKGISVESFTEDLINYILKLYPDAKRYEFTTEEREQIAQLANEKYSTWEWNYGKSPDYNFSNSIKTEAAYIEFHLEIKNGIIEQAKIYGDFFSTRSINEFEKIILHKKHDKASLTQALKDVPLAEYFGEINLQNLVDGLMGN